MASKLLRGLGFFVLTIVVLLVIAVGAIFFLSDRRLSRTYSITPPSLTIPGDSMAIERGRHLASARLNCVICHDQDLGGSVFIDGMPFGRFVASNLTRGSGGVGGSYQDADWVRAIRDGIGPDGKPLLFMPSHVFALLGAEDLAPLIAYLKSLAPVDRQLPATALGPIGRMVMATSKDAPIPAERIDHAAPFPVIPTAGPTVDYGRYVVATGGCTECHGQALSGGKFAGPDDPPARNITPTGIGQWTEAEFIQAFREGKRPDGTPINPFMPWKTMGKMTEDELRAIYLYLKTVPPKPDGQE